MRDYQRKKSIEENTEICKFKGYPLCRILSGVKCDGYNKKCSFYKTEYQFIKDEDRAILINQAKGNCDNCRYVNTKCTLSNFSFED